MRRSTIEAAARALSLALALAVFGVLALVPFIFGGQITGRLHGAISLLLTGASAAAVHGFGFRPQARLWRPMFSAPVAWLLMACGAGMLASA